MSRASLVVAAGVLGASCSYRGTPIPTVGITTSLEGKWEGTYSSKQTGRTGSILFQLTAGTDSAYGDVLMIPARAEEAWPRTQYQVPEHAHVAPHLLRISFVKCEPGKVSGRLEPYEDPDTHERVITTFEGRQYGNEFRGTFSTTFMRSGGVAVGEWSATRKAK
ncbi:MAG: hypothetical protein HOP28_07525 [Gemmatimonadales bacterium]|nr:hypothetical protein [Gemmatimonadales bacterium]